MRGLVLVLALAGCIDAPGAPPDLAKPRPREPTVFPRAVPVPPPPPQAEVEISGRVKLPRGAKGDVLVFAVDRPCWQPGTRAFGQNKVINPAEGYFFLEVFVPQGTSIWMCAALTDRKKAVVVHGELAAPLVGKGLGEVNFSELALPLAKGRAVTLPEKVPAPRR